MVRPAAPLAGPRPDSGMSVWSSSAPYPADMRVLIVLLMAGFVVAAVTAWNNGAGLAAAFFLLAGLVVLAAPVKRHFVHRHETGSAETS